MTCLLRNLYAGQKATVRTGHGLTDWFLMGKGVRQGCILSACLFNFYAEYIMRNRESRQPQRNPLIFQLSRSLGSETSEDFCLSSELTCKLTRSPVVLLVPLCFSGYYEPVSMCLLKDRSFYIPLGRKVKVTPSCPTPCTP